MTDQAASVRNTGRAPLHGTPPTVTVSAAGKRDGVVLRTRTPMAVQQVIARRGRSADVVAAARRILGVELPAKPRIASIGTVAALWSGPDQWLLMAEGAGAGDLAERCRRAFEGIGASIDQSDSRVHLSLGGPNVRDALAKLIGIDIDARVFPVGEAAMTVIAHIPVHVWRRPDAGSHAAFEIAGPQSFAASLWHHVVVAAAEFGLDARVA